MGDLWIVTTLPLENCGPVNLCLPLPKILMFCLWRKRMMMRSSLSRREHLPTNEHDFIISRPGDLSRLFVSTRNIRFWEIIFWSLTQEICVCGTAEKQETNGPISVK